MRAGAIQEGEDVTEKHEHLCDSCICTVAYCTTATDVMLPFHVINVISIIVWVVLEIGLMMYIRSLPPLRFPAPLVTMHD